MDRTERLLDLVALLLDARAPIGWAELREAFPGDYASGSDEASERKFERDKAELLEVGIPIRYVQGDDDGRDGYVLDREAYYLPELGLEPEELAVLYAAGAAALASGAFPGKNDLAHALRKIGFSSQEAGSVPAVRMELGPGAAGAEVTERLEQLWSAIASRKRIDLVYASPKAGTRETFRKVDPFALALRRGAWSLVGHCHLREDLRTFQVQRIRDLKVNASKPKTPDYEIPEGFQLDQHVARHPWEHRFHAPREVCLLLTGERARLGSRLFPGGTVEEAPEGTRVRLSVGFFDGLLRYVLSLAPECRPESPPELVERFEAMARKVFEEHSDDVGAAEPSRGVGS